MQEEVPSGRVRVTVKNVAKDSYVSDVHVKAIGSRNSDFVSGQTDLRGVFVGDNLTGTSTVIAQADGGRYAFFRGTQELGPPPQQAPTANAPAQAAPAGTEKSAGAEQGKPTELLLEQLQRSNGDIQQRNNTILDNNYKQLNKGVRAKEAF